MKTLHLILHAKWFDMILSGEKKEEYRELSAYWRKRIQSAKLKNVKIITFSNGYSKNRRQMAVELDSITIGEGLFEWGALKGKTYFVLHLGNIISKNF